jgi:hypothetical protein
MKNSKALKLAGELIKVKGLAKGTLYKEGSYCALGAIASVCGASDADLLLSKDYMALPGSKAIKSFASYLGESDSVYDNSGDAYDVVYSFSDHCARVSDETFLIQSLRAAAKVEKKKEKASV